ncbi:MAG TPA: hypothetical protein VGK19_09900 [Capsulimonadaceae bacterium]
MTNTWQRANADWLHKAKFGTMTHFLADTASNRDAVALSVDDWNRRVDSVDVEVLAQQIASTGSKYHIFTLGQNSGFFCSPNNTYDNIVGRPSRLSNRDLLADLATALAPHGVRTIAYLPSHAPALHRQAVEALKFTPPWDYSGTGIIPGTYVSAPDVDTRLTEGLRNWEAIIREWSVRWGDLVSGWWFDGGYYADKLYRHADEPNFRSFAAAAKAGNANSLVAFNPGVKMPVISMTEYEDYTAGEINELWVENTWRRASQFVDGAQFHVLSFLGIYWGSGPLRMPDELAVGYTKYVASFGGATTWDVPISKDGKIPDDFLAQLTKIGEGMGFIPK